MALRNGRIKAVIAKDIADIVMKEIKNPKIGLVSINEVVVNSDYSEARVYVTFFSSGHEGTSLAELKKSEGFVRSRLASRLDLYKAPKVTFLYDDSFKKADRLEEALKKEESDLKKLNK